MPNTRNNSTADGPMLVEPFDSVEQDLWELVDAAIARSLKDGAAPDPILGPFSEYFAFLRSIQTNQGDLLRDALSILLRSAGLTVYTELHLPISEAAKQAVKSNSPEKLSRVRLDPHQYAEESYRADIVAVDAARQFADIIEVKRSSASMAVKQLAAYRNRMSAAAFALPDILWRDKRVAVVDVNVLLLDVYGMDKRRLSWAVGLPQLEAHLGLPGLADAIAWLDRDYIDAFEDMAWDRCSELIDKGPPHKFWAYLTDPDGSVPEWAKPKPRRAPSTRGLFQPISVSAGVKTRRST